MHYTIDGYNVLFRVLRKGNDLKTQRESFLAELNEKVKMLDLNVTLVFDAQYAIGEASRFFYDTLEVHFTDLGETADEYILKTVRRCSHPRQEVVVTSDSRLAWAARRHLVKTETVEHFLTWLNKRYSARLLKSIQPPPAKKAPLSPIPPSQKEEIVPQADPVDNFAYYLQHFEQRLKEFSEELDRKPKKKKGSKRQSAPPEAPRLPGESEIDRWLRLFEDRDPSQPE